MRIPTAAVVFTELLLVAVQFLQVSQARPTDALGRTDDSINITDEYIVVLKDKLSDSDFEKHTSWASDLDSKSRKGTPTLDTYSIDGFKAYQGLFDRETIKKIADSPEVEFVEPNRVINALPNTTELLNRRALAMQTAIAASLGRISHRQPGSLNYVHDTSSGMGTWIYILSSGINIGHSDFGGRATYGYNAVSGSLDSDANGSGTALAGVIAGSTYGVAKLAHIISVKVLDDTGSGTIAQVIAGLQWAVNDIVTNGRIGHAVICIPLGGAFSAAMSNAVNSASSQGIPVFVPAGSSNINAANTSPASAASAIVIGSLGITDIKSPFSNYGAVVDFFAPSMSITTTSIPGNTFATFSGASLSTGIAAGLAAYLQGLENLPTAVALSAWLTELSTVGLISGLPADTANRILYNGSGL